jgi:hypothetical protein
MSNMTDTVTSGQGPKEPQTGDDELAELRRHGECSGADLRALIARLDEAEAKCADYQRQAFGESPDTVTITVEEYERMTGLIREIAGITCYDTSAHGVACCLMRFEGSEDWCIPCTCRATLGGDG